MGAQEKLAEEKVSRMKEAQTKLDEAIAERLRDVHKQMQPHLEARMQEAKTRAELNFQTGITNGTHPELNKEAEDRILAAELRVRDARAHLLAMQEASEAQVAAAAEENGGQKRSDDASGSNSGSSSSSKSKEKDN